VTLVLQVESVLKDADRQS